MYRFGDSTPFPLRENFIDTLGAVVDAAADLYRAEAVSDEAHRKAREARKAAADELRRLDALSALLQNTIAPLAPSGSTQRESDVATTRLLEAGRDVIARSRDAVVRRRDEAIQSNTTSRHHELARAALETLLVGHGLPHAQWSVEWSARDGGGHLSVALQATKALAAELAAVIPPAERLGRALRVAELCPGLANATIADAVDRKRGSEKLGTLSVLEIDLSAAGLRMALGRPEKRTGGLIVARRDGAPPVASWRNPEGEPGARLTLDVPGEAALGELADAIVELRDELIGRRSELVTATLHGQPIDSLEQPAALAEEVLASVAPLVREMRLRSRVPGELVLKRDLGGDRREELLVPRRALCARFADLPEHFRRAFEAIGLGDEATVEFRVRVASAPGETETAADEAATMPQNPSPGRQRSRAGRSYGEPTAP
jgi:hypothetical protein